MTGLTSFGSRAVEPGAAPLLRFGRTDLEATHV